MIMDREWMAARPTRLHSMDHHWRDLLFMHWIVSAEVIQAMLPDGLTVDTFDGNAYVGLVPFRISRINARSCPPVPGFCQFPEINVRTYVHREGCDPGVWFFSLDAANVFACIGARISYHLPYFYAEMSQSALTGGTGTITKFSSKRYYPRPIPAYANIEYIVGDEQPAVSKVGTLEHFLIERYLLYSFARNKINVGQVYHTPYSIQPAELVKLDENLVRAAGIVRPDAAPLIHFSRGVDVNVYPLQPVVAGVVN